ncbi:MAG: hypothetical protein OEY49_08975, partial [Candidatus Heimdallarchaeota archaeon]|nr:hypothetical protein [Candidatus Heimdallarchaeota archaeon]
TVEYMDSKVTISDYQKKEQEVTELYRSVVKKEGEKGFNWKRPRDGSPSYHWDMIRTLQHAIYHMGMISNLRHMVGAPKLENVQTSWEEMVDSVFEIAIK